MLRYLLTKLLLAIPTILIVAVLVFTIMRLVPGDPAMILVGDTDNPAALAEARAELGLDQPYATQFWRWLSHLAHGDFGVSLMTGESVWQAMVLRFGVTAQIVCIALLLAAAIALPLGTFAAWRQNRLGDFATVLAANLCLSVPSFWVGLLLLLFFGAQLNWLPTVGYVSIADDAREGVRYLILPVAAIVFLEIATILRMVRASTLDVLRQDFVLHARAKGLSEAVVLARHVMKNAFIPTMTLIGLILGSLLGGVAVIETVFTLPGLGRFLVDGIYARDYAVVQGCLLFVAMIHVAVNLLIDLLYPLVDPRVRL
jgi:peptide/nickel transport system permease protein